MSSRREISRKRKTARLREIVSDVLITTGVLGLFFYLWYVWLGDLVAGAQQDSAATSLSESWDITVPRAIEFDRQSGGSQGERRSPNPPLAQPSPEGSSFAAMIVPRFGPHFERTIEESVDVKTVLNDSTTGVGHYSSTSSLGALGNFALAAHRGTFGASFGQIDQLRVGDRIYIETKDGWYVYRFRNMEFVYSSELTVLNDVPKLSIEAKERILTMTTCHPKGTISERFVAYSIFESFVPRDRGAPSEVAGTGQNP
jgi:sortase A